MNEVRLYGHLRKFGHSHRYDIQSPAEAISALKATLPGFTEHILERNSPGYRVMVGDDIIPERALLHLRTNKIIRIVPVIAGGGGGGVFGIILGIALLIVAPELAPFVLAGSVTGATIATSLGVSLILSGISSMLSSSPSKPATTSSKPTNTPSYLFNGVVNVTNQGNPVPIAYGGPIIVGSQVISGGLSAEQVAA